MVAKDKPSRPSTSDVTRESDRLNSQLDEQIGNNVAVPDQFNDAQLSEVRSIDDVMRLLGGEYVDSRELGSGFEVVNDKDQFVGRGMMFVQWRTHEDGKFGAFTICHVVTEDGGKYILNDGSTGIHRQLVDFTKQTGKQTGMLARKGLTRSDYDYTDDKGDVKPATTYYIA